MSKRELKPGELWGSERGYKLPQELVQKFYDDVIKLAEETFGRDCDNDLPVDIHIIDRTRFEPVHYLPVEYRHKIKEDAEHADAMNEKLEDRLHTLCVNLSMASGEISREMKHRQHERYVHKQGQQA